MSLKLPFNPPRVTAPQLQAGSSSGSLCNTAHHPLLRGSKTPAQAAPRTPNQPQGLSIPRQTPTQCPCKLISSLSLLLAPALLPLLRDDRRGRRLSGEQ